MWLLLATLFLLGATQVIGGFPDHVLPPLARWGWWTMHVYVVGVASLGHPYGDTPGALIGICCLSIFLASYGLMFGPYMAMMPPAADDWHWPTVFALVNVIIPISLAAAGPLLPAIVRNR